MIIYQSQIFNDLLKEIFINDIIYIHIRIKRYIPIYANDSIYFIRERFEGI